jgi:hypothetical protein
MVREQGDGKLRGEAGLEALQLEERGIAVARQGKRQVHAAEEAGR